MCLRHWRMVPKDLQQFVWQHYRPGQCDDKNPSNAWFEAADAAIDAVYNLECEIMRRKQPTQLMAKSVEHYGPGWLADMSRAVMGGIDLDPASCATANQLIGAKQFYTAEQDGLRLPWHGRVYLNPPGGECVFEDRTVNSAALWWATLALRYAAKQVTEAIYIVFSQELWRYAQRYTCAHPLDFAVCWPKDRINFHSPGEAPGETIKQKSATHSNAIVYLGPPAKWQLFHGVFSILGRVDMPRDPITAF